MTEEDVMRETQCPSIRSAPSWTAQGSPLRAVPRTVSVDQVRAVVDRLIPSLICPSSSVSVDQVRAVVDRSGNAGRLG